MRTILRGFLWMGRCGGSRETNPKEKNTETIMDNYLKIRNFGPVKDAVIELKPFLVLIGGQGTGKSTIAKLLTICQDYLWYVNILQNNEHIMAPFKLFNIHSYFTKHTFIEYKKGSIHIIYKDGGLSPDTTVAKIATVVNRGIRGKVEEFGRASKGEGRK